METLRTVTNENGIIKQFATDADFLEYAKKVYKENEDGTHTRLKFIGCPKTYIRQQSTSMSIAVI